MRQPVQLNIPKPCSEDWNNMIPSPNGRFCLSCRKEVVDFSAMSDAEILKHISMAAGSICGRAQAHQMNRNLTASPQHRAWWPYGMGLAASFLMFLSKSPAQVRPRTADTVITAKPGHAPEEVVTMGYLRKPRVAANSIPVRGRITDSQGNPIPMASILIKGTEKGVVADEKGGFAIELSRADTDVLVVSMVGFASQEIKPCVHYRDQDTLQVKLQEVITGMLGDVVIVRKKRIRFPVNWFRKDSVQRESLCKTGELNVYPNPVLKGADIMLSLQGLPVGTYRLLIHDIAGNDIAERKLNSSVQGLREQVHCDERFVTGIYVATVSNGRKTASCRFIVQ